MTCDGTYGDSRFGEASVSTAQPPLSTLIAGGSCPATRGLGIAGPPVINERPRSIGGPLERSLRSRDDRFRRLGSATVVVSIRGSIGEGYFCSTLGGVFEGVAQRSHAPLDRNWKDHGEGTSVPLRLRQFTQCTIVPYFGSVQDCTVEITLDMSQPGADCCFTIITKSVRE